MVGQLLSLSSSPVVLVLLMSWTLMARVMVLGVCPHLLWPGVGGLLVHRLWWLWFPLVADVAGGDTNGGVMPAMVCLMLLAWVI